MRSDARVVASSPFGVSSGCPPTAVPRPRIERVRAAQVSESLASSSDPELQAAHEARVGAEGSRPERRWSVWAWLQSNWLIGQMQTVQGECITVSVPVSGSIPTCDSVAAASASTASRRTHNEDLRVFVAPASSLYSRERTPSGASRTLTDAAASARTATAPSSSADDSL